MWHKMLRVGHYLPIIWLYESLPQNKYDWYLTVLNTLFSLKNNLNTSLIHRWKCIDRDWPVGRAVIYWKASQILGQNSMLRFWTVCLIRVLKIIETFYRLYTLEVNSLIYLGIDVTSKFSQNANKMNHCSAYFLVTRMCITFPTWMFSIKHSEMIHSQEISFHIIDNIFKILIP